MKLLQDLGVNLTVASSSGRSKCLSPSLIFGEMWMFNAVEFCFVLRNVFIFLSMDQKSTNYRSE